MRYVFLLIAIFPVMPAPKDGAPQIVQQGSCVAAGELEDGALNHHSGDNGERPRRQ